MLFITKTIMTTDWIIAATARTTVDGRTVLTNELLKQVADVFDPKLYGARINLEHLEWYPKLGDVVATKYAENDDGVGQLFVKLKPNARLLELNSRDQAVYLSIEMTEHLEATGTPYLVGLALTDTPASLGTSRLKFNNNQSSINTFTLDTKFDFSVLQQKESSEETNKETNPSLISKFLKNNKENTMTKDEFNQEIGDLKKSFNTSLEDANKTIEALSKALDEKTKAFNALNDEVVALKNEFAEFKATTESAVQEFSRPPATGDSNNQPVYM